MSPSAQIPSAITKTKNNAPSLRHQDTIRLLPTEKCGQIEFQVPHKHALNDSRVSSFALILIEAPNSGSQLTPHAKLISIYFTKILLNSLRIITHHVQEDFKISLSKAKQSKDSKNLTLYRTCEVTSLTIWFITGIQFGKGKEREAFPTKPKYLSKHYAGM